MSDRLHYLKIISGIQKLLVRNLKQPQKLERLIRNDVLGVLAVFKYQTVGMVSGLWGLTQREPQLETDGTSGHKHSDSRSSISQLWWV